MFGKDKSAEKIIDSLHVQEKEWKRTRKEIHDVLVGLERSGLVHFTTYLYSPWRIMWTNLLAGIFRGLGIIIGMTVVFGVVLGILSHVVDFPLIGEYFRDLKNTLESISEFKAY